MDSSTNENNNITGNLNENITGNLNENITGNLNLNSTGFLIKSNAPELSSNFVYQVISFEFIIFGVILFTVGLIKLFK